MDENINDDTRFHDEDVQRELTRVLDTILTGHSKSKEDALKAINTAMFNAFNEGWDARERTATISLVKEMFSFADSQCNCAICTAEREQSVKA